MSEERWLPVPGYEKFYEVSNKGCVRSLDRYAGGANGSRRLIRGKVRKPGVYRTGHRYVSLRDGRGGKQSIAVHRLVLMAFVGLCPEGMEGCHNDGDPTNNNVDNLRWDTRSGNVRDTIRHGNHNCASKTACVRGHEFSGDNFYIRSDGGRRCRICQSIRGREWYLRKKKGVAA